MDCYLLESFRGVPNFDTLCNKCMIQPLEYSIGVLLRPTKTLCFTQKNINFIVSGALYTQSDYLDSIPDTGKDFFFSPLCTVQTGSGSHQSSNVTDTGDKAAGTWSYPLTTTQCQGYKCVEFCLHPPNTCSWRGPSAYASFYLCFSRQTLWIV